jgi:flagellin-specific chaperone FliS
MSPADAYKMQNASRWTRIEMLLELFDTTLLTLERARSAEERGEEQIVTRELIAAQRLVAGLIAAINPESGELSAQLGPMYLFIVERIGARDIAPAVRVLSTLRDAFEGIRPQAIAMELTAGFPGASTRSAIQIEV